MQSYQTFIPGNHFNSIKNLNYIAEYNNKFNENKKCSCVLQEVNKTVLGTGSGSSGFSYNIIKSQIIQNSKGGTIQYGSSYLNKPTIINYLGRTEGMPGGGGSPPKNKF